MAGGGDHSNSSTMGGWIRVYYRPNMSYLLLPEFPFKTAKLLFDVPTEEDSADLVAAPPELKRPLDDEDVLTEIFCRLPPLPSPLARAFLVSRLWARLGASAASAPTTESVGDIPLGGILNMAKSG